MVRTDATALAVTDVHGSLAPMLKLIVREVAEREGFENPLQLAQAAELPYESVRRIWNGTTHFIALRTLERLCFALKVRPAQLMEYEMESSLPAKKRKRKP